MSSEPGQWERLLDPNRLSVACTALFFCLLLVATAQSFASAQSGKKPLSKDDVIGLLKDQLPSSDIAGVARGEGISFAMDAATEQEMRSNGADDSLINVLWDLSPKPRPKSASGSLSKTDIINLLQAGVTPARVSEVAKRSGINFVMDANADRDLRAAGAGDALIQTLYSLSPGSTSKTTPPVSPPPPQDAASPVLLIEATPGGAQVYIDDEPKATTSSGGRVKFSDLSPGMHVIRLSLAGYTDHEEKVELKPGQTSTVFATLAALKPPSAPSYNPPSNSQPGNPSVNSNPIASQPSMPVATFLVAHDHGFPAGTYCLGTMSISGGKIHFQGVRAFTNYQPGGATHTFDISGDEIKEVKRNNVYLSQIGAFHIKLKKGTNMNMVVVDAQGKYQPPDQIISAIESSMNSSR